MQRADERRVLLVEDDWLIAADLAVTFREAGADVVGPAGSVADALAMLADTPRLDGAVVDINLHGEMAWPVLDALAERGVPVVFATGYDAASIPDRYAGIPRCEKPVDPSKVARALFG